MTNLNSGYDSFEQHIGKLSLDDHIEEGFSDRTPYFTLVAQMLVERFHPQSALDIMCGWGNLVSAFRREGVEAYGVDISEWAIAHTSETVRGRLRVVDCERDVLPFPDDSFDLVTCNDGMEHLHTPEHIILEIKRVLKPGGVMFAAIPTPPFESKLWQIVSKNKTHVSLHSKSTWIKIFEKQGFEYTGDFRDLIRKGVPLRERPFWLGRLLLRLGPLGRWFWLQLAPYLAGRIYSKSPRSFSFL